MTTKPATPLPWEDDPGAIWNDLGNHVVGTDSTDDADAAYIVHAANAYPRLTDELAGLCGILETLKFNGVIGVTVTARARALLAELGETE